MQSYQNDYPNLFSPMKVGKTVFRNRVVAAPTHHSFAAAPDDRINMFGVKTYGERALGGVAAVTIGEGKMDDLNSTGHTGHIDCYTQEAIRSLQWYSEYVHSAGAIASIEFNHAGQFAQPAFNPAGMGPMGASECVMPNGLVCREMTREDMAMVADHYAKACVTAKTAGLDMVTIHLGHGWLLGGFLSPMFNHRTDEFGGSLENRLRFPKKVLQTIRDAVGKDFLIEIRLSGDELTPNGLKIEDTIEIIHQLEDIVNLAHLSCGTRLDPLANCMIGPDHFTEPGHNASLSEAVKKAGVKIPIGVVGNITKPELAERILANGQADYIVMARPLIADPDWVKKVKEGREEDIRPCIKCSRCGDMLKSVCSVNPLFGNAAMRTDFPKASVKKKVAVVGGGVAGMQAAIALAERGHDCTLFEKEDKLGGQLFYTDYVWFKQEMKEFRDYLIREVKKAGVSVRLNCEASPSDIEKEGFDGVIVAAGAEPNIPPIPGVNGENVMTALDVFGNEEKLPSHVVIVGGGLVGCELSLHLAAHNIHSVVIEMGDHLAPDADKRERTHLLFLMEQEKRIQSFTGMRCSEIISDGVRAVAKTGESKMISGQMIILASGMKSRRAVCDSFADTALDVIEVGDAKKVSNIYNAVSTGYSAALII